MFIDADVKNKHDAICTFFSKLLEVPPFVDSAKLIFSEACTDALKVRFMSDTWVTCMHKA